MDRIALIIGNSKYKYVTKLNNPCNDANDIGEILTTLGFDVNVYYDLTIAEMEESLRKFLIKLDQYTTGLFFYAGHGMQIDGENFLVPIDCELKDKTTTVFSCFSVNHYLSEVAKYKGKTNICILDACRNNPFADVNRDIICGFAHFTTQPKGTFIAFSTSMDSTASDGEGTNGLYTSVLKEMLLIPHLKIEEVFKSTRAKVFKLSNEEQLSWEHSCLMGDFYFCNKEINYIPNVEKDEYLWKKRIEIDLTPLDKVKILLQNPKDWLPMGTDGIHSTDIPECRNVWFNKHYPEYTISYSLDESRFNKGQTDEIEQAMYWMKRLVMPLHNAYMYHLQVKYHSTIIYSTLAVFADNYRFKRVLWKNKIIQNPDKISVNLLYSFIEQDSLDFLLDNWLCMNSETVCGTEESNLRVSTDMSISVSGNPYSVIPVFILLKFQGNRMKKVRKYGKITER